MPVDGGERIVLCDILNFQGVDWGDDNSVVFGSVNTGLSRVSAEGGIAEKLFETKPQDGDLDTDSPDVLPGSHAVLYTLHQLDGGARIEAYVFETGERRVLVDDAFRRRYAATGHIVYGTGAGTLFAASFDLARLEITGPPVRVLENVFTIKDGPGMVYTRSPTMAR